LWLKALGFSLLSCSSSICCRWMIACKWNPTLESLYCLISLKITIILVNSIFFIHIYHCHVININCILSLNIHKYMLPTKYILYLFISPNENSIVLISNIYLGALNVYFFNLHHVHLLLFFNSRIILPNGKYHLQQSQINILTKYLKEIFSPTVKKNQSLQNSS
jgi:hypothetical protein